MPEPSAWRPAAALEVAFAAAELVALPEEEPVVEEPPVDAPLAAVPAPVEEPVEFDDPMGTC